MKVGMYIRFVDGTVNYMIARYRFDPQIEAITKFIKNTHRVIRVRNSFVTVLCPIPIGRVIGEYTASETNVFVVKKEAEGPCRCDWSHCRRRVRT